jgi:Skp family chaperone for outer membrane proteins
MKISSLALVSLVVVAGWSTNAFAQQARTPSGTLVAVVDIGQIFEKHPKFKASMQALQDQAREVEKQLGDQQKALAAKGEQLKGLKTTSVEYRNLESQLAQQLTDLKVKARQHQKEFVEKEAANYLETYNEILMSIQRIGNSYGIGLVMRFDSRPIDANSPQSIALGMKRDVVWQRNLDITGLVLKDLGIEAHELPGESPAASGSTTTRR